MNTTHLHPSIIHYPIALFTMVIVADFAYLFICKKTDAFRKAAFYLQIFATLGAIAAVITGGMAEELLEESAYKIEKFVEQHAFYAIIATAILIISSIVRLYGEYRKIYENKKLIWSLFVLNIIGLIFILITGYLGGVLVYGRMLNL